MIIKNNILLSVQQDDIKNKTLIIPNEVNTIGSFFLKNINVEKVIFGYSVSNILPDAFNESNVKEVILNDNLTTISQNAFLNCKNLESINLNNNITSIEEHAFFGCTSLNEIYIGDSVSKIENGAFACSGIKNFNVSKNNKNFFTDNSKKLLINKFFNIVSYAVGSNVDFFNINDYVTMNSDNELVTINPLYSINNEAFRGSINLKSLIIPSSINLIGYNSFQDCPNLNTLEIVGIELFSTANIKISDNGKYLVNKKEQFMPFTTLKLSGKLNIFITDQLLETKNIKNIIINDDIKSFQIQDYTFNNILKNVHELYIPENVDYIDYDVYKDNLHFKFHNGFEHVGPLELSTNQIDNYIYQTIAIKKFDTYSFRVYKYKDYISKETLVDVTFLNEDDLKEIYRSDLVFNNYNPNEAVIYKYVDSINKANENNSNIPFYKNGIFISLVSENVKKILISYLNEADSFTLNIIEKSKIFKNTDHYTQKLFENDYNIYKLFDYINLLKKYNVKDEVLYDKVIITNGDFKEIEYLITNHYKTFVNVLNFINLNKGDMLKVYNENFDTIYDLILKDNSLSTFINKISKYNVKNKFLCNANLIKISDNPLFDNILKYYDGNMKRLLKTSGTLLKDNNDYQISIDLLTLMKITGCFNEDKIKRQKNQTFIIEKVFTEHYTSKQSITKITKDEIHSIFNFTPLDEEIDEFEDFFRENYLNLLNLETIKSGYIKRIYERFKEISEASSSNKGEQRHLKVTIEKCVNYLTLNKFKNIPNGYEELATLIGEYFDDQKYLDYAIEYVKESKKAPRNIFIAPIIDNDKIIYDNDPKHDLKEKVNQYFSYEWLPKQDYKNLILGKYCNCCAHVGGNGAGIVRASMLSDEHQNLVIKNSIDQIVAKATIYVNKSMGYAVFNTIEASFKIRNIKEYYRPLYEAFIKATKEFVKVYNENYEKPITVVSVGANRNYLINILELENHPTINPLKTIDYSKYKDDFKGNYNGDSSTQKLVLKLK